MIGYTLPPEHDWACIASDDETHQWRCVECKAFYTVDSTPDGSYSMHFDPPAVKPRGEIWGWSCLPVDDRRPVMGVLWMFVAVLLATAVLAGMIMGG